MKWRVTGAHRSNGAPTEIEIDAATEAEAIEAANMRDVLVDGAAPVVPGPKLDYALPSTPPTRPAPEPVPVAPPAPASPPPPPDQPMFATEPLTGMELIGIAFFWLLGIGLIISGFAVTPTYHSGSRFQSDNAYGATANAIEDLQEDLLPYELALVRGHVRILIGVLCIVLASLVRVRATIRNMRGWGLPGK